VSVTLQMFTVDRHWSNPNSKEHGIGNEIEARDEHGGGPSAEPTFGFIKFTFHKPVEDRVIIIP
jgi:hypothetical protein